VIAVIGSEGIVCAWLPMAGGTTPSRDVVYNAWRGFRLSAHVLLEIFNRSPAAMHLLLRYTQPRLTQTPQMAVYNRHHPLEERLCHWLLVRLNRESRTTSPSHKNRSPPFWAFAAKAWRKPLVGCRRPA